MTRSITVKTKHNQIWLDDEGILNLKCTEMGEMDLAETMECFEVYRKLGVGEGKKVLQLIDMRVGLIISSEGRDYAARVGRDYFIASAVVSNSLAVRFIVNFFNRFYKHKVPFRIFSTNEKAIEWLRKQKK